MTAHVCAVVVENHDVLMHKPGDSPSFSQESLGVVSFFAQHWAGEQLDGHFALQQRVAGAPDGACPTSTNFLLEEVASDVGGGGGGHIRRERKARPAVEPWLGAGYPWMWRRKVGYSDRHRTPRQEPLLGDGRPGDIR